MVSQKTVCLLLVPLHINEELIKKMFRNGCIRIRFTQRKRKFLYISAQPRRFYSQQRKLRLEWTSEKSADYLLLCNGSRCTGNALWSRCQKIELLLVQHGWYILEDVRLSKHTFFLERSLPYLRDRAPIISMQYSSQRQYSLSLSLENISAAKVLVPCKRSFLQQPAMEWLVVL